MTDDELSKLQRNTNLPKIWVDSIKNKIGSVKTENLPQDSDPLSTKTSATNIAAVKAANAPVVKARNLALATAVIAPAVLSKQSPSKEPKTELIELKNLTTTESKPTIVTSATKAAVVATESKPVDKTTSDTQDIINMINTELNRLDSTKVGSYAAEVDYLSLKNGKKITAKCFLHYLSEDPEFLKPSEKECADINDFISRNTIDIKKLISAGTQKGGVEGLPDGKLLQQDTEFFNSLYNFNLRLLKFVADPAKFNTAKVESQAKILDGLQQLIKETIMYSNNFMEKYKIINPDLIEKKIIIIIIIEFSFTKESNCWYRSRKSR